MTIGICYGLKKKAVSYCGLMVVFRSTLIKAAASNNEFHL
jgi:hypothetical protein